MNKQQCVSRLLELFPEQEALIKNHLSDYGEVLLHVLSGEIIQEPLIELLHTNRNKSLILKYCNFIEEMWKQGTEEVVNVVDVSILERLSDDGQIWERFGWYVSDEFREYINEVVLNTNIMMAAVKKLESNILHFCKNSG